MNLVRRSWSQELVGQEEGSGEQGTDWESGIIWESINLLLLSPISGTFQNLSKWSHSLSTEHAGLISMGSISELDHNSLKPREPSICGDRHYPVWAELKPLEMRREIEKDWMRKYTTQGTRRE